MKKYESFDLWAADQTAKHKKLIAGIRKLVKKTAPKLVESVKWGNGIWLNGDRHVIYLYADTDHLQFGFFMGSKLSDPKNVLLGKAMYVRHIKIFTPKDINPKILGHFIRQVAKTKK